MMIKNILKIVIQGQNLKKLHIIKIDINLTLYKFLKSWIFVIYYIFFSSQIINLLLKVSFTFKMQCAFS